MCEYSLMGVPNRRRTTDTLANPTCLGKLDWDATISSSWKLEETTASWANAFRSLEDVELIPSFRSGMNLRFSRISTLW